MYKNIGKKIKGFSIFFAWVLIIASCFFAFYRLYQNEINYNNIIITALIIIAGTFLSVVISWFMYAFGDIADNVKKSKESLETIESINSDILSKINNKSFGFKQEEEMEEIPIGNFKIPETKNEVIEIQLKKLKKDYEMSRITYDEYEERKRKLEAKK